MTRIEAPAVAGRPPLAPAFAFPVIDRFLHARPGAVVGLRRETKTVVSLEVERPAGFRYRTGHYAMLRLETEEGPDMRPLSIARAPDDHTLELPPAWGRAPSSVRSSPSSPARP